MMLRESLEERKASEIEWFAMTGNAFDGYGGCYTVMQSEGRDTLVWECE